MNVQRRQVWTAVRTALLGAITPLAAGAAGVADWRAVPDAQLDQMRGGLRVGELIGSFAIERVVRIDGELVAYTQLVFDFTGVKNGELPSLRVVGELSNLIQVSPVDSASITAAVEAARVAAEAAATGAGADAAAAQTAMDSIGAGPPPGGGGSVVAVGSDAVVPAIPSVTSLPLADTSAPPVAAGPVDTPGAVAISTPDARTEASVPAFVAVTPATLPGSIDPPVSPGTREVAATVVPQPAADIPAAVAVVPIPNSSNATVAVEAPRTSSVASVGAAPAPQQPSVAGAATAETVAGFTIVRPVGNTGAVIVVSNLPDATTLATAIQNQVAGTVLNAQTTISGSLSSLSHLQSGAFADALRQQILQRGP